MARLTKLGDVLHLSHVESKWYSFNGFCQTRVELRNQSSPLFSCTHEQNLNQQPIKLLHVSFSTLNLVGPYV